MKRLILVAALTATPAFAGDYSTHHVVRAFTERPCGYVASYFSETGGVPESDGLPETLNSAMDAVSMRGLIWGFILGFDHGNGGLWRGDTSTLMQFLGACKDDPLLTGADVLSLIAAP